MVQIAIDGPAGAGKSTVAKLLAERLKYIYLDTGSMYRTLTYKSLKNGISIRDHLSLIELAKTTSITFQYDDAKQQRVFCDGEDVTEAIRYPKVTEAVSIVAAIPDVRESLVVQQRQMASTNNIVMDGRDIGTVVLPKADFKFFLTASLEERAKRRLHDLQNSGMIVELKEVIKDIAQRDRLDTEREVAPLRAADDAHLVDTSNLTVDEVVNYLINVMQDGGSLDAL